MANTLGNLSLSDMKWLGTPADPVGSYQKGVNLAEQKQRMGQSADMHPLKMQAAEGDIAYRGQQTSLLKQQGVYNDRTMDSRVGLAASADSLQNTAAWLADETKTYKKSLSETAARMQKINADDADINRDVNTRAKAAVAERAITNQEINANTRIAQEENYRHTTAINKTKSEWLPAQLHNQYQANQQIITQNGLKIERQTFAYDQWNKAKPFLQEQMRVVDSLSPADLENYEIPFTISESPEAVATIKAHILNRKSTKIHGDHVDAVTAAEAELKTVRTEQTNMVKGLVRDGGHKLLDAHRNDDGTLTHSGEMLLGRLTKSKEAMDKLKAAGIPEAVIKKAIITAPKLPPAGPIGPGGRRGFIGPGAGILPPGAQHTSNYGDLYDGMPVLDDDGFVLVDRLIKEKGAARLTAAHTSLTDVGLIPTGGELKSDGTYTSTYKKDAMTAAEAAPVILEQIDKINEENELSGTKMTPLQVRFEASKRVYGANLPYSNGSDAKARGFKAGSIYFDPMYVDPKTGAVGAVVQVVDQTGATKTLQQGGGVPPQSGIQPQADPTNMDHLQPGKSNPYTGKVNDAHAVRANDVVKRSREIHAGLMDTYEIPKSLATELVGRSVSGIDYDTDKPVTELVAANKEYLTKQVMLTSRDTFRSLEEYNTKSFLGTGLLETGTLSSSYLTGKDKHWVEGVMPQVAKKLGPFLDGKPGWRGPKEFDITFPKGTLLSGVTGPIKAPKTVTLKVPDGVDQLVKFKQSLEWYTKWQAKESKLNSIKLKSPTLPTLPALPVTPAPTMRPPGTIGPPPQPQPASRFSQPAIEDDATYRKQLEDWEDYSRVLAPQSGLPQPHGGSSFIRPANASTPPGTIGPPPQPQPAPQVKNQQLHEAHKQIVLTEVAERLSGTKLDTGEGVIEIVAYDDKAGVLVNRDGREDTIAWGDFEVLMDKLGFLTQPPNADESTDNVTRRTIARRMRSREMRTKLRSDADLLRQGIESLRRLLQRQMDQGQGAGAKKTTSEIIGKTKDLKEKEKELRLELKRLESLNLPPLPK